MKKVKIILAVALMFTAGSADAQLGSKLKDKISGGGGKGKSYDDWTDADGVSGTYYTNEQIIDGQNTIGFQYTKEKEGTIVHELYVELGGKGYGSRPNSITCAMKEKYLTKYEFRYFYITGKDAIPLANNNHNFVFLEIEKDIYAFAEEGKVLCVAAKDAASFETYDTETAQVVFDQKMAKVNQEAMEKETAEWMKNEVYKNNVNKIVFATEDYHLMKRGYTNKRPEVNGKDFKTVLDMAKNMNYMAFFKFPPKTAYPGAEINIVYEMNGIKVSRTEIRKSSSAWSKMVPIVETKDFEYRQHSPRSLRSYNQYHSQWVQDYAFIYCLYQNKDQFMIGTEYDLNVKMYSSREGENVDLMAEGNVKLLYSSEAHTAFTEQNGIWEVFEKFLNE